MRYLVVSLLTGLVWMSMWQNSVYAQSVARIGDWQVTMEALDEALRGPLHELQQQRYQLRFERLQTMVAEKLIRLEADRRGISEKALLRSEVDEKIVPISDDLVEDFIEKRRDQLPNGGEGMEEKVRIYLSAQVEARARGAFLSRLYDRYGVEILLHGPPEIRYEVRGPEDLARGPADAPVTIVEFSDFECPYCRRVQKTLKTLEEIYPNKIRLLFRHFPLPFHHEASKASEAAQCAADQGRFWEYHDRLFVGGQLDLASLKKTALEMGLDGPTFDRCLQEGQHADRIASDLAEGKRLGVDSTPAFFINGKKVVGALPVEQFQRLIEEAL